MIKIPREILDALEDIYKNNNVDPREYPGVHIHWQGCGDSGGIEECHFLTNEGLKYCKQRGAAPPTWVWRNDDDSTPTRTYYKVTTAPTHDPSITREIVFGADTGHEYVVDEWVYRTFDVCEINEGGYADCFIEMPFGNCWGSSYQWVQEEHLNVSMAYED